MKINKWFIGAGRKKGIYRLTKGARNRLKEAAKTEGPLGNNLSQAIFYRGPDSRNLVVEEVAGEVVYSSSKPIKITIEEIEKALKQRLSNRYGRDSQSVLRKLDLI